MVGTIAEEITNERADEGETFLRVRWRAVNVIVELAAALHGAPIQDTKVYQDREPGVTHHFWSVHGGATAYVKQVDRRFVSWSLENKPIGAAFNEFLSLQNERDGRS